MNKQLRIFILLSFLLLSTASLTAQETEDDYKRLKEVKFRNLPKATDADPYIDFKVHKNGRFWNTVINNGIIGNYFDFQDPELQLNAPNYFFPRYLRIQHGMYTALWVGGLLDGDTLVSTSVDVTDYWWAWWRPFYSEFWPEEYPYGAFGDFSNINRSSLEDLAKSEMKFKATFTDTFKYESFVPYNEFDARYHKPLNIKVEQVSYSWAYKYAEDFIIVDYKIINLGNKPIKDAYLGLYHVGSNYYTGELPYPKLDDIEGYIKTYPYEFEELGDEDMNISWSIDVDGYPMGSNWYPLSTRNAFGIAPLGLPESATTKNFNWWINDYNTSWGPRQKGTADDPLRLFSGRFGMPVGDKNKYYMMAHPEVDYNGYFAAVDFQNQNWIAPPEYALDISDGHYVHYLTSFGPFDIEAGRSQNVTVVYTIGENVHNVPEAYREYFDPYDPELFMTYLDFEDLIDNVRWAKRIYDNPGVDTDLDGDSGKYFFLVDTVSNDSTQVFYSGDGVPDFRGATPPPPPPIRVTSQKNQITVRWNGREVENYFDSFSLLRDFEGYRVYIARSIDENDISLLASYDQENYSRYLWNRKLLKYELKEIPFTLDSLRTLFGQDFQPLEHTRTQPFYDDITGTFSYFLKVDNNESDLTDPLKIHKIYPDATLDTSDVDEEGRMRYYEYEFVINDLLPTVPYFITVTSFDFGNPAKALPSLESSKSEYLVKAFAVDRFDETIDNEKLHVYCYPNPYRMDENYEAQGFENRFTDLYEERSRTIYFANLPNRCSISIYSLDGDLIKKIEHDEPKDSGTASVARFDMISRNDQAIVSGLYYWVVESEFGNQIGKLVIIK